MRLLILLLALSAVSAQTLELPKPEPPKIPPPKTAYTAPPPSKWDSPLLYSQMALAAAGAGATAASQIQHYKNPSTSAAVAKVGAVGLLIVLQRAYHPAMSDRTKKWLSFANFAAAGVMAGFAGHTVDETQTTLNSTGSLK